MSTRPIDLALRLARAKGWNQTQFAGRMGVTPSDISNWKDRGMPAERHATAADTLGISVEELLGRVTVRVGQYPTTSDVDPPWSNVSEFAGHITLRLVPVVGTAQMGDDGFYEEISSIPGAGDGMVEIGTRDPNAYGLRVRGMSMFPAIREGWYVVVEPNSAPREGEYVLIKLRDGRKMVKEFLFRRNGSVEVMSVNGQERIHIDNANLLDMQAVGAVVPPSKWRPD